MTAPQTTTQAAPPAMDPAYAAECGSCHVPYAAGLLPAEDWKTLLKGLAKHFGSDASMDDKDLAPIRLYLLKNARKGPSAAPSGASEPRITATSWFKATHRDAARGHWPEHKSAANCEACHPSAKDGRYRELSDPLYGID
ncbi:cytochrome C [Methylotetracoccus oryzae]|uniref:cytochrome C n=1 Tax=Methylotetracoccus oryzae TaxID=1919059 RepID=UPI0013A57D16|nr:cytochrome C [Methylotetracoccus oryzae]